MAKVELRSGPRPRADPGRSGPCPRPGSGRSARRGRCPCDGEPPLRPHPQVLLAHDPADPLVVDPPTFRLQLRRHAPVAVARELGADATEEHGFRKACRFEGYSMPSM